MRRDYNYSHYYTWIIAPCGHRVPLIQGVLCDNDIIPCEHCGPDTFVRIHLTMEEVKGKIGSIRNPFPGSAEYEREAQELTNKLIGWVYVTKEGWDKEFISFIVKAFRAHDLKRQQQPSSPSSRAEQSTPVHMPPKSYGGEIQRQQTERVYNGPSVCEAENGEPPKLIAPTNSEQSSRAEVEARLAKKLGFRVVRETVIAHDQELQPYYLKIVDREYKHLLVHDVVRLWNALVDSELRHEEKG